MSNPGRPFRTKMVEALEHFPFINLLFELDTLPVELKLATDDPEYKDTTRYMVFFTYKDRSFKIKPVAGLASNFGTSVHFQISIKLADKDSWRLVYQVNLFTLVKKVGNQEIPIRKYRRTPYGWPQSRVGELKLQRPKTSSLFVFDPLKFNDVLTKIFTIYDTNIHRAAASKSKGCNLGLSQVK